jgi:CRP-like cAMP-binding protein
MVSYICLLIDLTQLESFFTEIKKFLSLSDAAQDAVREILVCKEFKKRHIILKPNSVCNYVYFVDSGLVRTFYEKDGKDVTDWLSPENSFSCSILSFINRIPDRRGIEAVEDSQLWALHYDDLDRLYNQYHEIERLGRLLYGLGVTLVQQRFDDLHFSSASERYQKMMDNNPTLIQRTPLSMIASYLGITQETLSRIRHSY